MIVAFGSPEDILGLTQRGFAAIIMGWFAAIALGLMATSSAANPGVTSQP